jgi:uncharacterized protein (TIGR00297 family)
MPFVFAIIVCAGIAVAAFYRGSLSKSGAVAAVPVGAIILGLGGLEWGIVLLVFFISSSGWSQYKHHDKAEVAEVFDKTGRRDHGQVLANGGVGAALALGGYLAPDPLWFQAYLGAMATVTADTWATELGMLSRQQPRFILNGKPVPAGTSGGITPWGTVSAVFGALLIGVVATLESPPNVTVVVAAVAIAGTVGMLADSLLGATVQARYDCAVCNRQVESATHCDTVAAHAAGQRWMTNDMVNVVASIVGAGVAILLQLV